MKVEYKKVSMTENEDGIFFIQNKEGNFENLTEKIKEMIQLGKPLNVKIWKARMGGGGGNRKPTYKYHCPNCGKEVKSNEANLELKCMDCNVIYERR